MSLLCTDKQNWFCLVDLRALVQVFRRTDIVDLLEGLGYKYPADVPIAGAPKKLETPGTQVLLKVIGSRKNKASVFAHSHSHGEFRSFVAR